MDRKTPVSHESTALGPALALPVPDYDCPVCEWTENFGRYTESIPSLISEVGRRFRDCGLPLARLSVVIRTLHPQFAAAGFVWNGDTGEMHEFQGDHQSQSRESYQRSPVRTIFEGSPGLRRRLADPDCPRDYPILDELDAEGITDYVILPLPFSHGHSYACSWATREPGGFSDTAIARIVQIMPVFSLVLEILATRRIARNLMDTYIGHSAGERVLSGEIYRGVNEPIEAVVWISDLRGFTRLSDEFAPPVVLGILNDHFERVVGAIADQGGEVLKFIGDGMLAIFEIGDIADARAQCLAALDAAAAARDAIAALNRERGEAPEIRWGLALDLGEVYYGNVGTPDRLDFTVIGKAVNLASRLEAIAADIGEPVVASQAFADASGVPMRDLGYHKVKGFEAPQAAFAPER